jgi:hypothetical protein
VNPNLVWKDFEGDAFSIEPDADDRDQTVIASILVGDHADGEEAGVYVTEEQARNLVGWLMSLLLAAEQRRKGSHA